MFFSDFARAMQAIFWILYPKPINFCLNRKENIIFNLLLKILRYKRHFHEIYEPITLKFKPKK